MEGQINVLEKLSDLKGSHPIETAEYVISQNLQGGPAFNSWVPHFIKKCEHVILLLKKWSASCFKKAHKFGVRIIKIMYEVYKIDTQNSNVLWTNSIAKEMTDVEVAVKSLEDGEHVPIGYDYICCHMVLI